MGPSSLIKVLVSVVTICIVYVSAQTTVASQEQQPAASTVVSPDKSNIGANGAYVDRIALCLDIKDNEPDIIDSVFPPNVKRLYCFTAIKGARDVSEIQHRWYYNDDLQASISLKIGSSSWRTYSAKSIPSVYTGEWRVSIVNSKNEEVLKTIRFHVQ
jgi:hypothetical protein